MTQEEIDKYISECPTPEGYTDELWAKMCAGLDWWGNYIMNLSKQED